MNRPTDNPRLSAEVQFEVIDEGEQAPAGPTPTIAPAPPGHETPAVKKPLAKGVFDRDQQGLTLAQRTRFNQLVQSGIEPKVARQLAVVLTKGGPGSGPQPGSGGGLHDKVLRQLKQTAREAREAGDHKRADAIQAKAAAVAARTLAGVKKSYAAEFVAGAKQALPRTYFNQLHDGARARAGGRASGMSRRAAGDEGRSGLMARRMALRAELAALESQLQKSGPVAQEVAVDAPVALSPKEAKRRKRLSEQLVDRALEAVKSAPPAGSERVAVQVAARVVKAAQPAWKRIVHSVVYSPGDVDAHGDFMEPEDIEKMAHDAMRSGLYVNHEHQAGAIEADIVESYIAPQDFNLQLDDGSPYHIPKGSHVMAMHVWGDEPWQRVLSGEYAGFSLEGTALREVA